MTLSDTVKGFSNRFVSATSFGLIPLFSIPVMNAGMDVPSMMVYRFGLGCVALLLLLFVKHIPLGLTRREAAEVALLALFYDVEAMLMIFGYNYISSGIATTLVFSYPIFTEVLMLIFFHERFSWNTLVALLLAFAGVALLTGFGGSEHARTAGIMIELMAGLSYAFYIVAMSNMRVRRMNSFKLTFYIFGFSTLFFIIFGMGMNGGIKPVKDVPMFCNLLLLGLVSTALSNVLLIPAIKQIGATTTAVLGAFEPLTAMIISITVFGDSFSLVMGIGFVLIIVSVMQLVLVNVKKKQSI